MISLRREEEVIFVTVDDYAQPRTMHALVSRSIYVWL